MAANGAVAMDAATGNTLAATAAAAAASGDSGLQPPPYERLERSVYLVDNPIKRSRMVCECTYDPGVDDPEDVCGAECINRMMNIECSAKSCPVGDLCTNQRLQRGEHADVSVVPTPPKGFGLVANAPIHQGALVYEYCGEIFDGEEFEIRRERYADEGRKHFYLMALDGGLFIDATSKGSVSRFINHSCDPNCETEKWDVQGEQRIGFFAIKDIAAGEEITFDYKFARYGEGEMHCFCGAANCRGVLGAKRGYEQPLVVRRRSSSTLGGSSGSAAKRRRLAVDSEAAVLEQLRTDVEALKDGTDLPIDLARTATFNKLFFRADSEPKRKLLAAYLKEAVERDNRGFLDRFIHFKGLAILRMWIEESASSPFVSELLQVLDNLPIKNKNMVENSKLDAAVATARAKFAEDETLGQLAGQLQAKWNELREVFVIQRASRGSDTRPRGVRRTYELPRDKIRLLSEDFYLRVERETGTRIGVSSQEASSPDLSLIKVRGESDSDATRALDMILQEVRGSSATRSQSDNAAAKFGGPAAAEAIPEGVSAQALIAESIKKRASLHGSSAPAPAPAADSEELLSDWEEATDPEGKPYYWNTKTMETVWDKPLKNPPPKPTPLSERPDKPAISGGRLPRTSLPSAASAGAASAKPAPAVDALSDEEKLKKVIRDKIGKIVVDLLGRYRKSECTVGRITSTEDFKHVARKITHIVLDKETRKGTDHLQKDGKAKLSEEVKHKIKNFVKEYMKKFGSEYRRT